MPSKNISSKDKNTQVPEVSRRSFLKAVLAGLISFVPVAGQLLRPMPAYAEEPCTGELRCAWGEVYYHCDGYTLWLCQDLWCWDAYRGDLCFVQPNCYPGGCC